MLTFKERVLKIVHKIPRGKTLSYKEIARLALSPRAYRAVGNILNKNRDFKDIPCHRVILSDGGVGGYVLGEKLKMNLLKSEGIILKKQL